MKYRITCNFDYCTLPYSYYLYQKYYIEGFAQLANVDFRLVPFINQLLAQASSWKIKGANRIWQTLGGIKGKNRYEKGNHVGRYLFETNRNSVRFAIDSSDGRGIRDPLAYEWANMYFKANWWPSFDYSERVYPIVNGNGILDSRKIELLRNLRNYQKSADLVFISRIYTSPKHIGAKLLNNTEHHIRLFETLSTINCSKDLMAIFSGGIPSDRLSTYVTRLNALGIPWSVKPIPPYELWTRLSKAKIVFQRPGKHHCIPWRMLDLLCMGTCIVYDQVPYPQWPAPLLPDRNYLDCGCALGPDESLPFQKDYDRITNVIVKLLSDSRTRRKIGRNNARYFDNNASPTQVAEYVIDAIESYLANGSEHMNKTQYRKN